MNLLSRSREAGTHLARYRLTYIRIGWMTVALLTLALFLIAIPSSFAYLQSICVQAPCNGPRLTLESVRTLHAVGLSLTTYAACILASEITFATVSSLIAFIIFWSMRGKSDGPFALFGAFTLLLFGVSFPNTLNALVTLHPSWALLVTWVFFLGHTSLGVFFYLFPDGHFVPHWIRWLALVIVIMQIPQTFFPGSALDQNTWPPLPLFAWYVSCFGGLVLVQIYRYGHVSNAVQRQQTKWVVFGITAAVVGFLALIFMARFFPSLATSNALSNMVGITTINLCILFIPLSIGIAIVRSRLWDIDIIIKCTLVYGTLTASTLALYLVVVVGLGTVLQARGNLLLSLLATGLIAVLFQPLRNRLQRGVNRLLYGERDDPYAVLSRLGQRLETTLAPEATLPTIIETVAQALKLPYAAISLKQNDTFTITASYGTPKNHLLHLPLTYQTEQIGELLLAPRNGSDVFSPADQRLLHDLARQAGIAVHAVQLTADLQRSRERLVAAREEERRRLRRDLHDGLGPTLGALTLKVGSARSLYTFDSVAADTVMGELEHDIEGAIVDIRRLVYALRPPALDELGLIGAIRECAMRYSTPKGEGAASRRVQIALDAPQHVPPLPAAVEVAIYRIAQEALTNVTRHAHARTCVVRLCLGEMLQLEITDDGNGLPEHRCAGVGLTSMRERAIELGGTCSIETRSTGGTCVVACLPLPKDICSDEQTGHAM